MVILDTDHMSVLEHAESAAALRLRERLAALPPTERTTTIISFEEQMRGWMAYLARNRPMTKQIEAYRRLLRQLQTYCYMVVLGFDENSAIRLQWLIKDRLHIGTMDLKIAAIALVNQATLLTRNLADFRRVPGLKDEDWTA